MGIRRRTLPLILLFLGIATSAVAIEFAPPTSDQPVRQPVSSVEASGRAGTLPFVASDVVLLIDHSTLALLASGIDVDADGVVGRNRDSATEWGDRFAKPARFWTTDSGDTIEALQLQIARALVPRLAARHNRVGLASFTLRARTHGTSIVRLAQKPAVIVPVGKPDAVLAALEDFPAAHERRRTDLTRLLERAAALLEDATHETEPDRPRVILLLSLGLPSAPDGLYWSSRRAVEYAGELAERGIVLWAIPFGNADTKFLKELTRSSGGNVVPLDRLDVQFGAPGPEEIEIENITGHARAPGRAG